MMNARWLVGDLGGHDELQRAVPAVTI